jgi:hypothetical protein
VDDSPEPPAAAAPAALISRFAAAESAIYPLAMTDPDRYERAVTVVGLVFQQLRRDRSNIGALVDGLPAAAEQATQLATAQGIPLSGLDPETLANAAAALRYRELVAASAAP